MNQSMTNQSMNLAQMGQQENLVQMGQGSLYPQVPELQSKLNSGEQVNPSRRQDKATGGQNASTVIQNVTVGRQNTTTAGQSQGMFTCLSDRR